jgi:hypothetical protein
MRSDRSNAVCVVVKSNALEDRPNRNAKMRNEAFGKQTCLIETALALPRRMQRNRNYGVETAVAQAWILERCNDPLCDKVPKMNLFSVFEI